MSVRVFLDGISLWTNGLSNNPLQCGWASSSSLNEKQRKEEFVLFFFPASLLELRHVIVSCLWPRIYIIGSLGFQAFWLRLYHTIHVPRSPAWRWQSMALLSLRNLMWQFLILGVSIYVLFLWRTLTKRAILSITLRIAKYIGWSIFQPCQKLQRYVPQSQNLDPDLPSSSHLCVQSIMCRSVFTS